MRECERLRYRGSALSGISKAEEERRQACCFRYVCQIPEFFVSRVSSRFQCEGIERYLAITVSPNICNFALFSRKWSPFYQALQKSCFFALRIPLPEYNRGILTSQLHTQNRGFAILVAIHPRTKPTKIRYTLESVYLCFDSMAL